jgi:hypothetical protein
MLFVACCIMHARPAPAASTTTTTTIIIIIIIIIKSIPGRVEELRILIVIGVSTPVKDLPALQLRYLIIRHPPFAVAKRVPPSSLFSYSTYC